MTTPTDDRIFTPHTETPTAPSSPPYLWILLAIVALVFVVALVITAEARDANTNALGSQDRLDCVQEEYRQSIQQGPDVDLNCEGTPPWYAETPFFSAAIAAVAVFIIGGLAVLILQGQRRD
jgi:hypothetical protein